MKTQHISVSLGRRPETIEDIAKDKTNNVGSYSVSWLDVLKISIVSTVRCVRLVVVSKLSKLHG